MKAEDFLNKHIEETNIPKDFYYYEIAQLMEDYAQEFAQQQSNKPQSSEVELPSIDGIQEKANNAVENFEDRIYFIEGAEWMRKEATELLGKEREVEKTVEERALELYPDKPTMDIQGWGKLQLAEYEREAYIKGATDNQMKTEEKAKNLNPLNEIAERKLKELRDADKYKGTDDSKDAITVIKEAMVEFAQQQEGDKQVDYQKMFSNCNLPIEQQKPQSSEVEERTDFPASAIPEFGTDEWLDCCEQLFGKMRNQKK